MRYLLMICSDENEEAKISPEAMGELMQGYGQLETELRESKSYVGAERLQPTSTSTTIRIRDGKTLTTDGPFAETKEQFGGYYLIEAADLDAATAWAEKIPTVRYGSVEIRPIWDEANEGGQ